MEKFVDRNYFLVTKTNTKGVITYANKPFIDIVGGNGERDLLHKPHSVVRHPDMPKLIFKMMWSTIKQKQEIFAYVKNKTFDGDFYWVFANVTASVDANGMVVGYYSVRRAPNRKAVSIVSGLYQKLLEAEKRGGIQASTMLLEETLQAEGYTYDAWVNKLQRL
ncbi:MULTISPECIES: PAS domain-containing protein [Helicobacter]|uniref:PAS domain-containing protein n=1 Tax=Helicobacter TaxID=209 RepID=UPI000EAE0A6D|nr:MULTISPECIES: PAS domain-containing protein [Helicobacter]